MQMVGLQIWGHRRRRDVSVALTCKRGSDMRRARLGYESECFVQASMKVFWLGKAVKSECVNYVSCRKRLYGALRPSCILRRYGG